MKKIVITSGYRWTYFEWFLLGFYELEQKGEVSVNFKLPFFSKLLSFVNEKHIVRLADKGRRMFEQDSYNLTGYMENEKGVKKRFVIDSADAPYLFHAKNLKNSDIYFKMQCPIDVSKDMFELTDEIRMIWLDHEHKDSSLKNLTDRGERRICDTFQENRHKIRPLMVGPRALSRKSFSRLALKTGYENYIKDRKLKKTGKMMCYFGNALGPKLEKSVDYPDYDWEADIMTYYKDKVNHPNEKRAKVAEFISKIDGTDARIISKTNSDGGIVEHKDLVIPLDQFCKHIASFQYNVNISGYRLSMPNRFIESFMVGTAVWTDKLSVKWYRPFEDEVIETVKMGYLPMDAVDWKTVERDLKHLPNADSQKVIEEYESKWKPEKVARYIIKTLFETS